MKEKRGYSHQDFFQFQNRINSIIADYDIPDLDAFYRISEENFPHLARIIGEMLFLARRGRMHIIDKSVKTDIIGPKDFSKEMQIESFDTKRKSRNNQRSVREVYEKDLETRINQHSKGIGISNVLKSKRAFPMNRDLGKFAKEELQIKIGWEWDSRNHLIEKIARKIGSLSDADKDRVMKRLQDVLIRSGESLPNINSDGFFTTWEKIISNQTKRRE